MAGISVFVVLLLVIFVLWFGLREGRLVMLLAVVGLLWWNCLCTLYCCWFVGVLDACLLVCIGWGVWFYSNFVAYFWWGWWFMGVYLWFVLFVLMWFCAVDFWLVIGLVVLCWSLFDRGFALYVFVNIWTTLFWGLYILVILFACWVCCFAFVNHV